MTQNKEVPYFSFYFAVATDLKIMKVLITGAAGFIGSHTAQRFASLGHEVVGLDNYSPYYPLALKQANAEALLADGVKIAHVDLRLPNLADYLPNDFDYIVHFAAQPGISQASTFEDYLTNNLVGTQNLLQFALSCKSLKYFVNIATSSIYGLEATFPEDVAPKPASYYGVTKLAAEQLVLAYVRDGLIKACSFRLYSVYGPRERPDKLYTKLIDCALTNKAFPLFVGSEKHLRSFTYVQDIVDGIVSVIGKENACNGQIINLGTQVESTTAQGIATVESILNTAIAIDKKPPRPGDQSRTCANIDKAKKLLNYNPQTTLREGLEAQVKWFKQQQ